MRENCGACWTCLDNTDLVLENPTLVMMIVCSECGNKRCPKATNHELECTASNEPKQKGSRYGGLDE